MKNILIVTYSLGVGGIESALINMLKNIDYNKYNVDLLLVEEENVYENEIPKQVNIIIKKHTLYSEQFKNNLKKFKFISVLKMLKIHFLKDRKNRNELLLKSMEMSNEKKYDYAIAYHSNLQVHIVDSIKSDKKIAYIHCDPEYYLNEIVQYLDVYEKFDLICCVSKKVKEKMIKLDSKLEDKLVVMTNIVDVEKIIDLSKNGEIFEDDFKGIRLLTVGRFTIEKGFALIPEILKKLVENNYNVKWYIVGDGYYKEKFEKTINGYNLQEYCKLLGYKENPFSYMKNCDIYIQPSLDESYCIATVEAKVLQKPVVRTNTSGAEEQFENMVNGIITDISVDGIYDGITRYIEDENLKNRVIENLKNEDFSKEKIDQIAKIEEILERKNK